LKKSAEKPATPLGTAASDTQIDVELLGGEGGGFTALDSLPSPGDKLEEPSKRK